MEDNQIMLSVWCRTYNHVQYIRDALEGFIAQRTNFRFRVVIFDDASTDGTSDVVREYAEKYPELFVAIIAEENTWHRPRNENYAMVMKIWEKYLVGKYISFCEGDDFWIDSYKLQLQVDYLESHPECIMACHDNLVIDYQNVKVYPQHSYFEDRYLTDEEVVIQLRRHFATASMVFRRELLYKNEMFVQCPLGDYSMQLQAITKGKIYFSTRIMSVYRFMHEGSWCRTHRDDIVRGLLLRGKVIDFLRQYDAYTDEKYHYAIIYKESLYIKDGIYLYQKAVAGKIEDVLIECNKASGNQYENYFTHLEAVYRQMNDEDYYPASMEEFVEHYSHIYIWGAGKYGKKVAEQLIGHQKDFEAFVVSEPSGQKVMGKLEIGINDISYPLESVGIIIAVNLHNWDEIRCLFENNKRLHYIYPYGVTELL